MLERNLIVLENILFGRDSYSAKKMRIIIAIWWKCGWLGEASMRQEKISLAKKRTSGSIPAVCFIKWEVSFLLCRMQKSQVTINSRYVIEMWKPWIGCLLVYAHKHGIILN